jgi:integrase
MAREVIAKLPVRGPYVFSANGRTPMSGWSAVKRRLDAHMQTDPWRLHDLRRTAVTGMARAGADLHVIERAVNHVSGSFGGIVGVYQKHRYADQVKAALEAWSRLLQQIVEHTNSNVVELRHA